MNTDYKVGELIYDANIYDGLNTFLLYLQFYKKWLPTNKNDYTFSIWCGMKDSLMKRYGVSEAAIRRRLQQLNLAKFEFANK